MDFKKLDEYMETLPSLGIPCADILVSKGADVIYRKIVGARDENGRIPADTNTMYDIYSNTKVVTTVAVMQLVEKGILKINDPVSKYLPSYAKQMYVNEWGEAVACSTQMTIEHLLTMTAGHGYQASLRLDELAKNTNYTLSTQEMVNEYAKDPLLYDVGERWSYGRSYEILGAIIEVASGLKFSTYLKKNIFEPLRMTHATFDKDDPFYAQNQSTMWHFNGVNNQPIVHQPYDHFDEKICPNLEMGGQGLLCTTEDYAKLLRALALGGESENGVRILSKESIDEIRKPRLDLLKQSQFLISHMKKGYGYGYGVRTLIDKGFGSRSPLGEFGWDGATGGYGLVDVDNQISVCYMQNVRACPTAYHEIFPKTRDMIYDIIKG